MSRLVCFFFLSMIALGVRAADTAELDLARQFLYCGELKIRVAKMNKDRIAGERERKNAEELMLVSVAPLIPSDQLDHEYSTVATALSKEIGIKLDQDKAEKDALLNFLVEKYRVCETLQKEKGLDAYKTGVEYLINRAQKQQ